MLRAAGLNEFLNGGVIRQINRQRHSLNAILVGNSHGRFCQPAAGTSGQNDMDAFCRQSFRNAPAQAGRGASKAGREEKVSAHSRLLLDGLPERFQCFQILLTHRFAFCGQAGFHGFETARELPVAAAQSRFGI